MVGGVSPGKPGGRRRTGQLPPEVTSFVGRKEELAAIGRLLAKARLVTVTGPGGVGKTRVALRAAAQASSQYADGVCFAGLSGLADPELIPGTVAICLGLPERCTRSQLDAVLDHLRTRQLLLILDTCEHIIDGCAAFTAAVLGEAPGITVLATSRQPLNTDGEHTYPVCPLPVPDAGEAPVAIVPAARSLGNGDAVELLAQRAAAAVPGFELSAANWADAVRLCRRLDGMPLAIELASVRLRALSLRELTDRLDQRFSVLGRTRRGDVPRHRTLRTAIEWSHDLCTAPEQALWARLSVFAGSFDAAAAEHVCAGTGLPRSEVLATLVGLVDKSVVQRDGARYRLLDTLRDFGAERLAAAGLETEYRGRHVDRYLAMARDFFEHRLDDDQIARYLALRREHANLRAAIEYGLSSADEQRARGGAALIIALKEYWVFSGMLREGSYWLGRALDRLPPQPSPERARALHMRGYFATFGVETARAVADTREGVRMAAELDDGLLLARGYLHLEMALMSAGRYEEAFAAGDEAQRRLEPLGDRAGLLALDAQMGILLALTGQPAASVRRCEQGLRRLGENGERWLRSYFHIVLSWAMFLMGGREADCAAYASRALSVKEELGDPIGCGYALEVLAWLAAGSGRHARAAWLLGAAGWLRQQTGSALSDMAVLAACHQDAVRRARAGIGDQQFDALHARGGACPLDLVVARAVADADDLPALDAPDRAPLRALTGRERQIAVLVAGGLSNREVADRLVISRRTVDTHVEHIYAKLGISSRVQLTGWLKAQVPVPCARRPEEAGEVGDTPVRSG